MANVTFVNALGGDAYLHMRIGAVGTSPDDRGTSNTVLKPGERADIPVGDGDVWYCYGNQMVSSAEDPELCQSRGGATATLDGSSRCYVDN
jgi:hypothetical protein